MRLIMLITIFFSLLFSGFISANQSSVRPPVEGSDYTQINAVVLDATRLTCPHAQLRLKVTSSSNTRILRSVPQQIIAENYFFTTTGQIHVCDRRNVGALAAYYLLPGDEINAKLFPGVARIGEPRWHIYGISRKKVTRPPIPIARGTRVFDGLEISLELEKETYEFGKPVSVVLMVINTADQPRRLEFSSGQQYDFLVTRGNVEIWRWSADKVFTQALTSLTVASGETIRFSEVWTQRDNQGRQVVFGEYQVVGLLPTMGEPRPRTMPVEITINPR